MPEPLEYLVRTAGEGDAELVLARERLARRQEELLAALTGAGPVPPGFDRAQLAVQATGLAAKRRETVARVAPEPAGLLGPAYGPLFLRYAEHHPPAGGHREDARAFAAWALARPGTEPWRPALTAWLHPTAEPATRTRRWLRRT
ncbi:hypothetical protein [Kitasatospora sp. MMS16-BH015]|uniref:hypothetical protein n=1 Tax=Kitasatospora sp. MMS16-BH015 TaxID=2018025 RepID=UPI00143DF382